MRKHAVTTREIAIPASVFESLHSELASESRPRRVVQPLHRAGYQAGLAAASLANRESGGDSLTQSQDGFWSSLSDFFSTRGWGTLSHSTPHRAIGILHTTDWAEAEAKSDAPAQDRTCSFSMGYLSGLLSTLVGSTVAVLEVSCQSRGDDACEFAFGSESAIQHLDRAILNGAAMSHALEEL